jgi:hypothetical protein
MEIFRYADLTMPQEQTGKGASLRAARARRVSAGSTRSYSAWETASRMKTGEVDAKVLIGWRLNAVFLGPAV